MEKTFSQKEIEARLAEDQALDGWTLEDRLDYLFLHYHFESFMAAIGFINQLATLAEKENHHPDISLHYRDLQISLSTHDANGVTERDFALAKKINLLLPSRDEREG